jgi:hypothetical protein
MKAVDPICGMQVEMQRTALTSEYRGQTYYNTGGRHTTSARLPAARLLTSTRRSTLSEALRT